MTRSIGRALATSRWARRLAALSLVAGTGCADDSRELAEFAELCGVQGPVRVLELSARQWMRRQPERIGDRMYYSIGDLDGEHEDAFSDRSVWSAGLCGEAPRRIAEAIDGPFVHERWPGALLGCHAELGVVSLDLAGVEPPHPLFTTRDCDVSWNEHGVLAFADGPDGYTSDLLLYPYPDDPRGQTSEPTALLEQVVPFGINTAVHIGTDLVHVLLYGGDLLRVDLTTREVTTVATGVFDFTASDDGRYLLWVGESMGTGTLERPLSLRDEQLDLTVLVGYSSHPQNNSLRWADRGRMVVLLPGHLRLYALPDLTPIDLPYGYSVDPSGPRDDGRWVLNGYIRRVPWLNVLDLADGTIDPLFSHPGLVLERNPEHFVVLDVAGSEDPQRTEGAMWQVPLDGSQARLLADRATYYSHRPDPNRLVAAVTIGDGSLSELILVDLATQVERSIDDHVVVLSLPLTRTADPTLLTYNVIDGERSGVWMARLPPAP